MTECADSAAGPCDAEVSGGKVDSERLCLDLIVDLAHEMRGPVSVLTSAHEAFVDGLVEPTEGHLSSLHAELGHLSSLIDDLQRLATAGTAVLTLDLGNCDLAACTGSAADSMAIQYHCAGVSLQRRLTQVLVRADTRRLHQVVTNLLSNAVKFTPRGGEVLVEVEEREGYGRLTVEDNGVGIPPDDLPRIFDRFWRGSRSAGAAGSGIGLAVVAMLVRAQGGRVDVYSHEGHGSRLTVTLPCA